MRLYDRAGAREVTEKDQAAASYQLSCILRDQGRLPDAERVLQEFVNQFRGMQVRVARRVLARRAAVAEERLRVRVAEPRGRVRDQQRWGAPSAIRSGSHARRVLPPRELKRASPAGGPVHGRRGVAGRHPHAAQVLHQGRDARAQDARGEDQGARPMHHGWGVMPRSATAAPRVPSSADKRSAAIRVRGGSGGGANRMRLGQSHSRRPGGVRLGLGLGPLPASPLTRPPRLRRFADALARLGFSPQWHQSCALCPRPLQVYGPDHHQVIKSMLQLASIAVAQVRAGDSPLDSCCVCPAGAKTWCQPVLFYATEHDWVLSGAGAERQRLRAASTVCVSVRRSCTRRARATSGRC